MSSSTSTPPSIRVSQHQRYHSPQPISSSFTASPMAIRGAQEAPPPPLPPPRDLDVSTGHDPGWQWGNDPYGSEFGRVASVKPGSSLLGSTPKRMRQEQEQEGNMERRGSSVSTINANTGDHEMSDERMSHSEPDLLSKFSAGYRLQGEKPLEQRTLNSSSHDYDKQMLSKIGGPNTPKRQSLSYPSGMPDSAQQAQADVERRNSQLRPLAVPEGRQNSVDLSPYSHSHTHSGSSHSRWPPSRSPSGAVSPGYTGFWEHGPPDSRTHTRNSSMNFDDSHSHRSSYDHSMFVNEDYHMEDSQMSNLHIHDRSPSGSDDLNTGAAAGTKRRASSPPREPSREERSSVSSASGQSDLYHRRSMQQLPKSPSARYHPNHSSLSSASSFGPRHGSLSSSVGGLSIPSSATSYGSGRISPGGLSITSAGGMSGGGLSPGAIDPDLRAVSPYSHTKPLVPSPIAANPQHQRTFSEASQGGPRKLSTDSAPHSRHASLSHMQGVYICECCPKKPRKFDTEDELRQHEAEKQYTCAYCPNRFKNKNEAERHQNSLHLRRHSWSCAALLGPQAAFHATTPSQPPNSGSGTCGYCGVEFPNDPVDWAARADHLNHVHKFGECNQAKKFFRADHFRQHLKHSHAGTSGKWTNMLETACMRDEPPPEKRVVSVPGTAPGGHPLPQLTISTVGLTGGGGTPAVLSETPGDG